MQSCIALRCMCACDLQEQMTICHVHGEKTCMQEQPDDYIHGHICGYKYDEVNTPDLNWFNTQVWSKSKYSRSRVRANRIYDFTTLKSKEHSMTTYFSQFLVREHPCLESCMDLCAKRMELLHGHDIAHGSSASDDPVTFGKLKRKHAASNYLDLDFRRCNILTISVMTWAANKIISSWRFGKPLQSSRPLLALICRMLWWTPTPNVNTFKYSSHLWGLSFCKTASSMPRCTLPTVFTAGPLV